MKVEENGDERLVSRGNSFQNMRKVKGSEVKLGKMHNHFINNYVVGNKKALLKTMCHYYRQLGANPFDFLPLTFHISEGLEDSNFLAFQKYYFRRNKEIKDSGENRLNMWIVKPGEYTNRGYGITICHNLR